MPHYEIIFEDGDHSIFNGTQDEVLSFAKEHHQRAKSGLAGGPAGHRATRISRILEYPRHPVDLTPDSFTVDEAKAHLDDLPNGEGGNVISSSELQAMFRKPAIVSDSAPHESNFRAESTRELTASEWGGGD